MGRNNYWVTKNENGWKTKKEGASRASGVFDTQKEAEDYGRDLLKKSGGGELITQNKEGGIRSKDTINKVDPNPPRDTEH